jgi:haloacetate dehalogenase
VIERCFDPLALWRLRAETATGRSLSTGHFMAEEAPDEIADELAGFFQ